MAPVTPLRETYPSNNGAASLETHASCARNGRPNILFFDHTAELGGGEIALLDLVRHLDRSLFNPIVLLGSEGPLAVRLREAGIETHVMPMDAGVVQTRKETIGVGALLRGRAVTNAARYALRVARFIRSHDIHLLHTNSLKADILGGMAARMARRPLIWHIRDRIEPDYLPRFAVWAMRTLSRVMPHCVIANSDSTLETLRLPAGKRTATVYSGLDLAPYADRQPHSCEDDEAAPSRPVVGLVGRISPWKGQHIFLEAAAIVRRRFPEARFQIIGAALFQEKEYEEEIHALCTRLGLDDCVEFLGFRKDVPQLLAGMTILAHASTSAEPFGQVVVQGMAAGLPVVATRGGGVTEIVVEGSTGLLVPMGDAPKMAEAIERLLAGPAEAREMGLRGHERVKSQFTIAHTAGKVEQIYREMLGKRPYNRPYNSVGSGAFFLRGDHNDEVA